jgi:hypothetical protein
VYFEHSSWKDLKQSLPVHFDIAKLLKHNIHRIEIREALHCDETAFISCFISVNADNLSISQVLFLLVSHMRTQKDYSFKKIYLNMQLANLASCSKMVCTHNWDNPTPIQTYSPHRGIINCVVWNHTSISMC